MVDLDGFTKLEGLKNESINFENLIRKLMGDISTKHILIEKYWILPNRMHKDTFCTKATSTYGNSAYYSLFDRRGLCI
jgi:hypothetical protein